jgi:hypothetical protein
MPRNYRRSFLGDVSAIGAGAGLARVGVKRLLYKPITEYFGKRRLPDLPPYYLERPVPYYVEAPEYQRVLRQRLGSRVNASVWREFGAGRRMRRRMSWRRFR